MVNLAPNPGWSAVLASRTKPPGKLVYTSAEFVAGFVPPDYLIDGVMQRRFVYSNTAAPGEGKTAITLTMDVAVAMGWSLGGHEVAQRRVLYFAGENPDDIRMRGIMDVRASWV